MTGDELHGQYDHAGASNDAPDKPPEWIPLEAVYGAARDVAAICRTCGDHIDFAFAHDVMRASKYPSWMLLAVAARMIVGVAGEDPDFTLEQYLNMWGRMGDDER